jgi:hypothetical protein
MHNTDMLFKSLFKRNFRSADTKAFLAALTKEHPYFTAAQFYLLKQTENTEWDFISQAAKTSLLFNNPFWLNFQLNQLDTIIPEKEKIIEKNKNDFDSETEDSEKLRPSEDGTKIIDEEILIAVQHQQTQITDIKNEIEPIVLQEQSTPIAAINNTVNNGDNYATGDEILIVEPSHPTEIPDTANNTVPVVLQEHSVSIFTPGVVINETSDEEEDYDNEEEEDNGKDIQPLNIKLNFDAAVVTKDDTISYQPLYTSDYFASLGIKLDENGKPVDKLGKQLKSFTDWLKIMKKIHPDQLSQESGQSDIEIQKMAEKSNTKGDILTEAMADVLTQQGKITKAIEVYQKLSLLNPSKSAYFAAKINSIES